MGGWGWKFTRQVLVVAHFHGKFVVSILAKAITSMMESYSPFLCVGLDASGHFSQRFPGKGT